ncbi:hypothetical protein CERSUDRAFT_101179 [Gelatoporia subvermispora B]|uniref:C2H2-type domain-containing protein n=1 Tax=Ceriporiopsis subvermispora (strain B) TaxID=914234 RepID=M2QVR3_CERS8|nr:hypothetical protein CERSUDRAFT_101179 [Gelatoporia subvermispora B]
MRPARTLGSSKTHYPSIPHIGCTYPGCNRWFKNRAALTKHTSSYHSRASPRPAAFRARDSHITHINQLELDDIDRGSEADSGSQADAGDEECGDNATHGRGEQDSEESDTEHQRLDAFYTRFGRLSLGKDGNSGSVIRDPEDADEEVSSTENEEEANVICDDEADALDHDSEIELDELDELDEDDGKITRESHPLLDERKILTSRQPTAATIK